MKKFFTQEGRELNLCQIPHTSFWTDQDGDLYQVRLSQCFPVSGYSALEAVLSRENFEKAYCPLCGVGKLRTSSREDYGYEKYFDFGSK